MTTIAQAVRAAADRLAATSDTARLDAELLMAQVLQVSRSQLLLRQMDRDAAPHLAMFEHLVSRRADHEPIAYLTGVQEFYGREFAVMPGVLIPRADSETTLIAALESAPDARRVLDCGTGPGTLLLSFLAERAGSTGIGIDSSATALGAAAANAEALGLTGRAQFCRRDWTQAGWTDALGQFDLVLANPPYVETCASLSPDVARWEPAAALYAGAEGLDDYRILIPQLRQLLTEGGVAIIEIGHEQDVSVAAIAAGAGFSTQLFRDLGRRPRALLLH